MTRKQRAMLTGAATLMSLATAAIAQRPAPGFRFNREGANVVTNEPYSGVGVTTSTQTLSNGTNINRANCVKVYRDSSGRTRREETSQSSTCSATPSRILITDPVAGVEYMINTQNNTYRQFSFKPPASGTSTQSSNPPSRNPNAGQTTSLGTQPIQGTNLQAQGTQTVITIPAGKAGNSQSITITSTRWYSPDLQIVIQSTRTDPRMGTTNYQLSDVSTAEPDATLFQLPAGLTQQQGFQGRGRRGR